MEASRELTVVSHECCPRCTALADYLRDLADTMGLRDWAIDVDHEPPADAGAQATVRIAEGRRVARVAVAAGFEQLEPDEQRHALVHELVHLLLALLTETVEHGVKDELGGAALRVYLGGVRREAERATDAIASALAPHLEMPPW